MKPLVASIELVWAVANLAVGVLMLTSAFAAKTAIKEGIPAQAVLLLAGLLMVLFAGLLGRECLRTFRRSGDLA